MIHPIISQDTWEFWEGILIIRAHKLKDGACSSGVPDFLFCAQFPVIHLCYDNRELKIECGKSQA